MLIKRDFGCCEGAQRFDIFAFLFEVAPVEATEYTGEILGARATWAVREMALRGQDVSVEKAVQDLTSAPVAAGESGRVIASLCDHLRIDPRGIEYEIAQLIFVM